MAPQVIRVMRVETLEGAAASHDQQLLTLRRENDDLRKQLAEARSELHDLRTEGSLSTRSSGTRREVRWSGKERGDGRSILSPSSSSSPTTAAARRYSLAVESALAVGRHIKANPRLHSACRRWMRSLVTLDPRTELAHFFFPGDSDGPLGYLAMRDRRGEAISSRAMGVNLYSMLQTATTSCLDWTKVLDSLSDPSSDYYYGSKQHLSMFPTSYFSVFRPTSKDALRLMMGREGTGKGLNIKGKSAQKGKLSGFVPFLQISENAHKKDVEGPPESARVRVYYRTEADRYQALQSFQNDTVDESAKRAAASIKRQGTSQSFKLGALKRSSRSHLDDNIEPLDDYVESSRVWGLELPLALLWDVVVLAADISDEKHPEFATGRPSVPAFMSMNLDSIMNPSEPHVVLFQHVVGEPMHPRGLLIAYEEVTPHQVKPVVSDLDCFLVGTKGKAFAELPEEQIELVKWELSNIEAMLKHAAEEKKRGKPATPWMNGWLERMRLEKEQGISPPTAGPLGYGDPTSCFIMSEAVAWTCAIGAVRHGAECFNYHFPQNLDNEYLVTWDGFPGAVKFQYMDEKELRKFLISRVSDGYAFPLNTKWVLCDKGWYEVWQALCSAEGGKRIRPWFPKGAGLRRKVEQIHAKYPEGFPTQDPGSSAGDGSANLLLELNRFKPQQFLLNKVHSRFVIHTLQLRHLVSKSLRRISKYEPSAFAAVRKARRSIQLRGLRMSPPAGFNVTPCRVSTDSTEACNPADGLPETSKKGDLMSEDDVLRLSRSHFAPGVLGLVNHLTVLGPPSLLERFEAKDLSISMLPMSISPFHEINLPESECKKANIPIRSAMFAFISPNHDIAGLTADEYADLGCFTDPQVDFVLNGGYIYIDAGGLLLDVNAVRSPTREETTAGLRGDVGHQKDHSFEIDGPYPLADVARKALVAAGRMQPVTTDFLRAMGAHTYAWVLPEETFLESSVVGNIARRASLRKSVKGGRAAIGPLPATFGAFAYARGHCGCYFRVIPSGVPHAHVTISSDMCKRRFAPFKLEPPLDSTIQELKAIIELRRGIPRRAQKLMRAGKELRDEQHLSECGISASQAITLHVLINMKSLDSERSSSAELMRGMTVQGADNLAVASGNIVAASENVVAALATAPAVIGEVADKTLRRLSVLADDAIADIAVEIRGVTGETQVLAEGPVAAEDALDLID